MELASVKAAVKSWEKAFRASHGRAPTKDDIKADPGDIGSQYALYRKLSKSDGSSSQSSQSRATSSSTSASLSLSAGSTSMTSAGTLSNSSGQPRSTPRIVPGSEYPTTPTPPSRTRTLTPGDPLPLSLSKAAAPEKHLKRTASKASLNGHPNSPTAKAGPSREATGHLATFLTPKKTPAYSGPIHDPNPINPFSASPIKISPIAGPSSARRPAAGTSAAKETVSPFIHASSPRKLREVLHANSLRKVKEREREGDSPLKEVTPRTRARKRLRGEAVEDTPMKGGVARRKRGAGMATGTGAGAKETNGEEAGVNGTEREARRDEDISMISADGADTSEDEDDEDEFGPSPMKPSAFTALLKEHDSGGRGRGAGGGSKLAPTKGSRDRAISKRDSGQGDIRTMFSKNGKAASLPIDESTVEGRHSPTPLAAADQPDEDPAAVPFPPDEPEPADRVSTPEPEDLPPADSIPATLRKQRVLTIEEDTQDPWDPEGGNSQRQLVIVPTRRGPQRRRGSSSDLNPNSSAAEDDNEHEEVAEHDTAEEEQVVVPPSTAAVAATAAQSPNKAWAPSLLSTLSLHSPGHRRGAHRQLKEDDLRVKAIFDPNHAARLRSMRRGEPVFSAGEGPGAGEGEEEGEEGVLARYDADLPIHDGGENGGGEGNGDVYGDDDWESENEGWKRSVGGLSDDEEW